MDCIILTIDIQIRFLNKPYRFCSNQEQKIKRVFDDGINEQKRAQQQRQEYKNSNKLIEREIIVERAKQTNNKQSKNQTNIKRMQCKYHSPQLIVKIQQPSLRPLCQQCINETQGQKKYRLQLMRASLNKDVNNTIKQLQIQKMRVDKMIQLFVGKNMTQAKKMINKKSLQAQKMVQTSVQRYVRQGNEKLREFTGELLQRYKGLEEERQLKGIHFEFDEQFLELEEKVEMKKKEVKRQVVEKVKEEMRNFYRQLFDFGA